MMIENTNTNTSGTRMHIQTLQLTTVRLGVFGAMPVEYSGTWLDTSKLLRCLTPQRCLPLTPERFCLKARGG